MMNFPKKHSTLQAEKRFNYLLFDSLIAFQGFVNHQLSQLRPKNAENLKDLQLGTQGQIAKQSDWYGLPVPKAMDELETHDQFLGMPLLEQLRPKIKKYLTPFLQYLDTQVMPKPKIAYNDRGIGMFSFDRAAMGLYHMSKINLSTPLEQTASQINIELGRDALRTHIKKLYAYFENKATVYPAMSIYLVAGANAKVAGHDMLYVGLACAELVDFLEARGVPVEVQVLLGSAFNEQVAMAAIPVKRFEDNLNKNLLLLLSSDPRYFRYNGFKALIAMSNYWGMDIPKGLGRLEPDMGKQWIKTQDTMRFVFEQSYSMESAAQEIIRIIETYQDTLFKNN